MKRNKEKSWPKRAVFSKWVREAKLALEAHSLAPVAKMLGLSLSTLYTLQTKNNPRKPSDSVLLKLAEFLGRDSSELTGPGPTKTPRPKPTSFSGDIWPQRALFKAHIKRYGVTNNKTLAVIADELGVRLRLLGKLLYEKERTPSPEVLEKAAALFGVEADIFQSQEKRHERRRSPRRPAAADSHEDHGQTGRAMPFRQQWLWEELGLGPNKALTFTIEENTMEPVLRIGDVVIVDLSADRSNIEEGLWMVRVGNMERIKKLKIVGPDQIEIISFNPDYPSVRLADSKWELIGRAVYRCGKM
jgi:phage repressor protein C with HTH and peptisase S24 domain